MGNSNHSKGVRSDYYDPNNISGVAGQSFVQQEHFVNETTDRFHIGQSYEDTLDVVLECKFCGGLDFRIAQGSCHTAISCVKCEYEICIHDG